MLVVSSFVCRFAVVELANLLDCGCLTWHPRRLQVVHRMLRSLPSIQKSEFVLYWSSGSEWQRIPCYTRLASDLKNPNHPARCTPQLAWAFFSFRTLHILQPSTTLELTTVVYGAALARHIAAVDIGRILHKGVDMWFSPSIVSYRRLLARDWES